MPGDSLRVDIRKNDWDLKIAGSLQVDILNRGSPSNSEPKHNHVVVTLHLPLHNGLRIDMVRQNGGVSGKLEITKKNYRTPGSSIKSFRMVWLPDETTVKTVIYEVIYHYRLQKFDFCNDRLGASHWQIVFLGLCAQKQWVSSRAVSELHLFLSKIYSPISEPKSYRIRQGTFEKEETRRRAEEIWNRMEYHIDIKIEAATEGLSYYRPVVHAYRSSKKEGERMVQAFGPMAGLKPPTQKELEKSYEKVKHEFEELHDQKRYLRASSYQGKALEAERFPNRG